MNDPHVVALIYDVEHEESVDYGSAETVEEERSTFRLTLQDGEARFELKEDYASPQQARKAIQPFIEQWELRTSLAYGPGNFALRFKRPEMIDRDPEPGVISVSADPAHFNVAVSIARVTVSRQYPRPPVERRMNLDCHEVQTMLHRYMGYRQGREPLASMAYFCSDVFVYRLGDGLKDNAIKHSAIKHSISGKLVKKVRMLASERGGDQSRKQGGIDDPLTHEETQFLERAVTAMILRAAIVAADPDQSMEFIDSGNLLEISP